MERRTPQGRDLYIAELAEEFLRSLRRELDSETAGLLLRLHASAAERESISRRARQYARVVLGFTVGAVLAAVVTSYAHFWAAAVPLGVIALAGAHELLAACAPKLVTWPFPPPRASRPPRATALQRRQVDRNCQNHTSA